MAFDFIYASLSIILLVTFQKIKKFIKEQNRSGAFSPNHKLLKLLLTVYTFQSIILAINFALAFLISPIENKTDLEEATKQCRNSIALNTFYSLATFSFILSTLATCYMNIKFSEDLLKSNVEFFIIFNDTEENIRQSMEEEFIEQ